MKSLRTLMEMFLSDARFPDEKFWSRDGSPIHPKRKGPPAGSGTTSADYEPKPGSPSVGGKSVHGPGYNGDTLYDSFSGTQHEFESEIDRAARKMFGPGWSTVIDKAYGPGSTKKLLKGLWDGNWSDYEGLGEVGHYFDSAQRGSQSDYPMWTGPRHDPHTDYPRTQRPHPDDFS